MSNQQQKAGAESQLLQAGRDIVISGISPADVVEITRREVARVVDELTLSARTVAEERVQALGNKILERFAQSPEYLGAFRDPDFQFSLNDAGRAAASNDDEHTEELLVDLLANRAEAGNTSRVRLATSEAIRAADKLSLETLTGMTALWALSFLSASDPENLESLLASLANIANAVAALDLPVGIDWLQEADALNLTRRYGGEVISRRPYRDMQQQRAAEHLVTGIATERFNEMVAQGGEDIPDLTGKVAPHRLKSDHVRLLGKDRESFLRLFDEPITPSPQLEEILVSNGFGTGDPEAVERWNALVDQTPAVATVESWWNGLPMVDFTLIGQVIGFVNAKRYVRFAGAQTVAELLSRSRGRNPA
jgi:hypothetical protein